MINSKGEERMKMQNGKTSNPPLLSSSGHRLSSAVLWWCREERNSRGGGGEWKLQQPFYQAAWEQAEILVQGGLNQECEHTALHHSVELDHFWCNNVIQSQIKDTDAIGRLRASLCRQLVVHNIFFFTDFVFVVNNDMTLGFKTKKMCRCVCLLTHLVRVSGPA